MEEFRTVIGTGVAVLLILATITGLVVVPLYFLGRASCNRVGTDSNIRTEYRPIGGCYVEVNRRMIPQDNWRGEYQQ